jgi:hypothetical protein
MYQRTEAKFEGKWFERPLEVVVDQHFLRRIKQSLEQSAAKSALITRGKPASPANAWKESKLRPGSFHIWSGSEVLSFKVAPAPWVEPQQRGRPRKVA